MSNDENTHFFLHVRRKIDEVVKLMRAERGDVEANAACFRVGPRAGVRARFEDEQPPSARRLAPHGNKHLRTALANCYLIVEAWEKQDWGNEKLRWSFKFLVRDWTIPDEERPSAIIALPKDSNKHSVDSAERPSSRPAPPQFNRDWLIRELGRCEREHGVSTAGFVVNHLLARAGFEPVEAKRILRAVEAQNIVRTERKPNPNDPDHPTTFVKLNGDHPDVARVLAGSASLSFAVK